MKWLTPEEETFVRKLRARSESSFYIEDKTAVDSLRARGVLSARNVVCSGCGQHDVTAVRFNERGKLVCLILDVIAQKPVV